MSAHTVLAVLMLDGKIVMRRDARSSLTADIFNNLSGSFALPDRADYLLYMGEQFRTAICEGAAIELIIHGRTVAKSTVNDPMPTVLTEAMCRQARSCATNLP